MPKNLVVDIGNTLVKFGVFETDQCVEVHKCSVSELLFFLEKIWSETQGINCVVLITVIDVDASIIDWLQKRCEIFVLSSESRLPFQNCYEDNTTLGLDRIALVTGAFYKYASENVLIISMGTCITYDFIDSNSFYRGGAIAPGMQMRLRSVKEFTARLPLVKVEMPDNFIAKTTQSCICSGVLWGVIDELEGTIGRYRNLHENVKVIVTGGDVSFFVKKIKSVIFAHSNLLLEGAYALMKYNLDEI